MSRKKLGSKPGASIAGFTVSPEESDEEKANRKSEKVIENLARRNSKRSKKRKVLFGVFRTADLEQQYDTVSHFGSIFSFNSTIHFGVSHSA